LIQFNTYGFTLPISLGATTHFRNKKKAYISSLDSYKAERFSQ